MNLQLGFESCQGRSLDEAVHTETRMEAHMVSDKYMVESAGSHAAEKLKPPGVRTFQHVVFGDRTDSELRTHADSEF